VLSSESTETHRYTYAGGKLLRETITETGKDKTVTTYTLDFRYDAQGVPYSLIVTTQGVSQTYYYITNLQGDVMYMVDAVGNQVAEYEYDPYGKIIRVVDATANASSSNGEDETEDVQPYANIPTEPEDTTKTLAELNPLRYRGYYYDNDELGFYYLQSRYYDPTICRFINADGYASTGQGLVGYNMFAYCNNSPIYYVDSQGRRSEKAASEIIEQNADIIIAAAEEFDVDPVTVASCIYAEQVLNYDWKDELFDYFLYFLDTSIGVGQVKVSTACLLEDEGYIEKTESLKSPSFFVSRWYMVSVRLTDNTYNIRCVAAYLRYWQDKWGDVYDISNKPDILGTLYNLGDRANAPNTNPSANPFGTYVKNKYNYVEQLLY